MPAHFFQGPRVYSQSEFNERQTLIVSVEQHQASQHGLDRLSRYCSFAQLADG
jgi:hypothetical protein